MARYWIAKGMVRCVYLPVSSRAEFTATFLFTGSFCVLNYPIMHTKCIPNHHTLYIICTSLSTAPSLFHPQQPHIISNEKCPVLHCVKASKIWRFLKWERGLPISSISVAIPCTALIRPFSQDCTLPRIDIIGIVK